MKERIYTVKPTAEGQAVRLVQAVSRAQALGHVARAAYEVEAASSLTVGQLMAAGTKLEVATATGEDGE